MVSRIFFIVSFILLGQYFCWAGIDINEQPVVSVEISGGKNIFYVGDKIKYQISVQTKSNTEIQLPDIPKSLGDFKVEDSGLKKRDFFGKKDITQWYLLVNYEIGEFVIPSVVIKYKTKQDSQYQEIETNELEVEIQSLLDKDEKVDNISDIKGPVSLPLGRWVYILLLLGLVIVGLAIWRIVSRKKQIACKEVVMARPAHLIAYEELELLKQKDYINKGKIKEYYEELSSIARCYLENRFSFKAPEMTTEEFLFTAENSDKLSGEHKKLLREFLIHCDLVKFAKYGPSVNEMGASFESAVRLVEQTKENKQ